MIAKLRMKAASMARRIYPCHGVGAKNLALRALERSFLRALQRDVEGGGVALVPRFDGQQELGAISAVDPVPLVPDRARPLGGVGLLAVDLIGQLVRKVELRGELEAPIGGRLRADLEVDVDRPARVPPGIDRREARGSVGV